MTLRPTRCCTGPEIVGGGVSKWLNNRTFLVGDITFDKKIIDLETGKIKMRMSGKVIGYDGRTSQIFLHRDRRVFKDLQKSKYEKVKLAD